MAQYQVCFIDLRNSVSAAEIFEAEDDAAAIAHARRAFPTGGGKGYELWQGSRHFHSRSFAEALLNHSDKLESTLPLGQTAPRRRRAKDGLWQRISWGAGQD